MEQVRDVLQRGSHRPSLTDGQTLRSQQHPFPNTLTPADWEAHRATAAGRPMQSTCPKCRGVGFLFRKGDDADVPVYQYGTIAKDVMLPCPACGTEGRKRWLAQHSGLEASERGRKLHDWRIPNLPSAAWQQQRKDARLAMAEALDTRTGWFSFWGDYGSGKTLALQIVVNELRELQTVEGYYAPFAVVLDHLRSLFNADRGTDISAYWRRLLDVPVLALDEVTRFKATDWAMQQLFVLADTRYRRRASHLTLFATNDDPRQSLSPDEAIGYLYSRMREGDLIELRGDVRAAVGGQ